MHGQQISKQL